MDFVNQELPIRVPASRKVALGIAVVLLPMGAAFVYLAVVEHLGFLALAAVFWLLVILAARSLLSDLAYLEFDAEGFTNSRPKLFGGGANVQRWLWADCRDFQLTRINHNLHLMFDHGPSSQKKGSKLNRGMFGRDQALIIQHQMTEQDLLVLLRRLSAPPAHKRNAPHPAQAR